MKRMFAASIAPALAILSASSATWAAAPDVIVKPDWQKKPPAEGMGRVYPLPAVQFGVIGKAHIGCKVSVRGLLEDCVILSEAPPGWGFGAAALAMTPYFKWNPQTVNGVPIGGAPVDIPAEFGASDDEPGAVVITEFNPDGSTVGQARRLNEPVWSQAPTPAQVAEAFSSTETGRTEVAYVLLRCRLTTTGSLSECRALSPKPLAQAAVSAALRLSADFNLSVADYEPKELRGVSVDVPIALPASGKFTPKVTAPQWVRSLDAATLAAVFPAKAVAAGVKRGGGVVSCKVTHSGGLNECRLISETPEGLGFGDAVLKAAGYLAMNPWTADGGPVDDAAIQAPITLALPEHQAPTSPAKP